MKWVVRSIAALLGLVIALGAGAYLYLRASLPQISGTIKLAGLAGPVEIARDAHGIPRIRAASETDAWFALGFVHAQERLTQMELMRAAGRGRLSEVLGRAGLPHDRLMRLLGNVQSSEAALGEMSPSSRIRLDAYAAGVNAFLESGVTLPPEFLAFGRPQRWTPVDSLLWARLMTLQLTGNWRDELAMARLSDRLPASMLDELWPDRWADGATTTALHLDQAELAKLLAALPAPLGPPTASNEFVVSGEKTASGRPLLANDPHLGLNAPGQWFLARIEAPGLTLVGATSPGVPALVLGHNGTIAWGFTTTHSDIFDLFVERTDPSSPERYETPDGPQAFTTRRETIRVRGGEDVTFDVRATRHGPVISDLLPEMTGVLALSFPSFHRADKTAEALFNLNRAGNWPEFLIALRDWQAPMQNVVYADRAGNIGFVAPGLLPRRKGGVLPMPRPGWSGDYDWDGFQDFAALPRLYNPAAGRIVNANNRIVPDDYPIYITRDWDSAYRARRVHERLDQAPRLDPATAESVMADSVSVFAREALLHLGRVAPAGERERRALERLRSWDCAVRRDRPEPLIFNMWMRELQVALFRGEHETILAELPLRERPELVLRTLAGSSAFCANRPGGCAATVNGALTAALDALGARYGADMDKWRWDQAHYAPFRHPIYDRVPVLRDLFGFRVPTDGDNYTVNRGAGRIASPTEPFAHVHGAGYRAVYDFADLDRSVFVATPGQSGHPLSRHWGDFAPLWANGKHVAIPSRVEGGSILTLRPR